MSVTTEQQIAIQVYSNVSLRDWLAGMAMQTLLTSDVSRGDTVEESIVSAYRLADAMMEERKK